MTQDEKIGYLKEHIRYEVIMLRHALGKIPAAEATLDRNAFIECFASETNGVPGGTISTPGSESKGNPIPPATRSSKIDQGYVIVVPPAEGTEVPAPPPPPQ
jgi:hypothetical protein